MAGLMLTAGRSKLPPIAIVTRLALQGCERVKTKLDREVDRLCAIDGGVHGYENVKLPKENFGPDGEVFPQYRADVSQGGGLGPDYKSNGRARSKSWSRATPNCYGGNRRSPGFEMATRLDGELSISAAVVISMGHGHLPNTPATTLCPT